MIFQLKASSIHGVGVFATERIKRGFLLPLFEDGDFCFMLSDQIKKTGIPKRIIKKYSIQFEDGYSSPKNFNRMSIGWYLNHSSKPNAFHNDNYDYFALRDIKKDEEITIDYDEL